MQKIRGIDSLIAAVEKKISELDEQRCELQEKLRELKRQRELLPEQNRPDPSRSSLKVTNNSSKKEKIALFRSLFAGREDVLNNIHTLYAPWAKTKPETQGISGS